MVNVLESVELRIRKQTFKAGQPRLHMLTNKHCSKPIENMFYWALLSQVPFAFRNTFAACILAFARCILCKNTFASFADGTDSASFCKLSGAFASFRQ